MDAYYPYLFPLLVIGLVAWQLKVGETFRMRWIPSVSRAEHKVAYWAVIAFQLILGGFGTYEGLTYGDTTTVAEVEEEDEPTVQVAGMMGGGGAPVSLATKAAAPAPTPPDPKIRDSAMAMHRVRRFADAVALYDVAVSQAPNDPELTYWRGVANWNTPNGAANALRDFRKTIELDPAHWNAHLNADRILVGQKKWDESLALWTAYLGRVPNSADALFERSGTNRLKGDSAAMRADAAKACQLGKRAAC